LGRPLIRGDCRRAGEVLDCLECTWQQGVQPIAFENEGPRPRRIGRVQPHGFVDGSGQRLIDVFGGHGPTIPRARGAKRIVESKRATPDPDR